MLSEESHSRVDPVHFVEKISLSPVAQSLSFRQKMTVYAVVRKIDNHSLNRGRASCTEAARLYVAD